MKKLFILITTFLLPIIFLSCSKPMDNPFWSDGEQFFDVQEIFFDERFPNVVTATDGSIIATWGRENYRVRRSEDGGETWGEEITISNPGFQGGGSIVDEKSGDVLVFVEDSHPPAPLTVYRSTDHGKTWNADDITIEPNSKEHTN